VFLVLKVSQIMVDGLRTGVLARIGWDIILLNLRRERVRFPIGFSARFLFLRENDG